MEKNQITVSDLGQRLERIETLLRGQTMPKQQQGIFGKL